jgi:hypothetical protein
MPAAKRRFEGEGRLLHWELSKSAADPRRKRLMDAEVSILHPVVSLPNRYRRKVQLAS